VDEGIGDPQWRCPQGRAHLAADHVPGRHARVGVDLDVELDKVTRHSDWSSPVLSPEQVRYAIADVTLLLPLMDRLLIR
jgi:hypothetical protein